MALQLRSHAANFSLIAFDHTIKCKICGERHMGAVCVYGFRYKDDIAPAPKPKPAAKIERAKVALATVEAKPSIGKTRGRPRKGDDAKPWIAAGVSKATWYRTKGRPNA